MILWNNYEFDDDLQINYAEPEYGQCKGTINLILTNTPKDTFKANTQMASNFICIKPRRHFKSYFTHRNFLRLTDDY